MLLRDRSPQEPRPRPTVCVAVTSIAKLLSGDAACEAAAWVRAHFTYRREPFDGATWLMNHRELVTSTAERLRTRGYDVTIEAQNDLAVPGKSCTVVGKPDLLAQNDEETLVIDAKTGMPRAADEVQVMSYMLLLPHAPRIPQQFKNKPIHGRVVYRTHEITIETTALDRTFRDRFRQLAAVLAGATQPLPTPSYAECRFCDIPNCTSRMDAPLNDGPSDHDLF